MNANLKTMTNDQLTAEARSLKAACYLASQAGNARKFGIYNRKLEAVYAEQDSRKGQAEPAPAVTQNRAPAVAINDYAEAFKAAMRETERQLSLFD